jgi:hypothetical protein
MVFKCDICGLYIPHEPTFFYFKRKEISFHPLCPNCESKMRKQLPAYNDILFNADMRAALTNLILENNFNIEDFFNLCIISENIVLHNNLFTFNPYTVNLLNSELFPNENIFKLFDWDLLYRSEIDIVNHNLWKEQVVRLWQKEGKDKGISGLCLETGCELFSISELFSYSFTPSIQDMEYIEPIIILKGKHRINSYIYNAYSSLSKATKDEIKSLKSLGAAIKIFIPPIMSIILDKATLPKDIPSLILEMRKSSQKIRDNFKYYEETIKRNGTSLKESVKAAHELQAINKSLSEVYKRREIINIKEFINTLIPKKIWDINKEDLDFKSITSFLLKEPIEALSRRLKNRGIMYFIDLKSKYLEIKQYGDLIKKIWNYDLTYTDKNKWETYWIKYDNLFP